MLYKIVCFSIRTKFSEMDFRNDNEDNMKGIKIFCATTYKVY